MHVSRCFFLRYQRSLRMVLCYPTACSKHNQRKIELCLYHCSLFQCKVCNVIFKYVQGKFREITLLRREKDTLLFLVKHDNRWELTLRVCLAQERNVLSVDQYSVFSITYLSRLQHACVISLCHVFCLFLVIYTFQLCLTMSAELIKLKFVRRPFVSQLSLFLMRRFISVSSGLYAEAFFFFYKYFSFLLTQDSMGTQIIKMLLPYKSQPQVFNLLLKILLNDPHKSTVLKF